MKGHESDKRGMFSSVGPNGVRQGYRFCAFCAGGAVFLNPVSQSLIIDGSVEKKSSTRRVVVQMQQSKQRCGGWV
jgi:hypothetical protein